MSARSPATTQMELIAVVAELRSEVATLTEIVKKLDKELASVTEFKNRSVYVATGVAIAFGFVGALLKTLVDLFKS